MPFVAGTRGREVEWPSTANPSSYEWHGHRPKRRTGYPALQTRLSTHQRVRNSIGESTRLLTGRCRFDPCRAHQISREGRRPAALRTHGGETHTVPLPTHGKWRNGSALGSDPRGCRFESGFPDQFSSRTSEGPKSQVFDIDLRPSTTTKGCRLTAGHWTPNPGIAVQIRAPLPVFLGQRPKVPCEEFPLFRG